MERARAAKAERHKKGLVPEERKANGLCLWCGEEAVNGTNACARHCAVFAAAGRKAKEQDEVVKAIWKLIRAKNSEST